MVSNANHGSQGSRKEMDMASKSNGTPMGTPARERLQFERGPSKDGAAQRAAANVEGLKGYQLGECLGKGAFGSVYKALNWGTGEMVAIKQVRLADLPKPELNTIMLEIDLLKNLVHPNIVKYHGSVTSTENLYIILSYCEGGSLHSMCKNFGKFPENLVALYMSQVLQGLLYLHEQGVIHRDIKGANILTTRGGLVKLADFGVATRGNVGESSVVGTPYWMAPEVIQLSGATTASDIWSLGCTVIELLDGKPPYHKLQPMPALFRIVNDDHPPLPEGASPIVRDFLMQCFQKDPNFRVSAKKLLKHPWIMNAKRAEVVPSAKPTTYDSAVKSVQEWNEAIKSPDADSLRRASRPTSLSPAPVQAQRAPKPLQLKTPGFSKAGSHLAKPKPITDAFRSPELDNDDTWDNDFDSSISSSALHLPHLKPQDNFDGMFSHERLKSLAHFSSMVEETIDEESEFAERNQLDLFQVDPLETVRPYTPRKKPVELKANPANTGSQRIPPQKMMPSQPRPTQVLKEPTTKASLPAGKLRLTSNVRPTSLYQEESDEDFSDMLDNDDDDAMFQRKLQELKLREETSFSPRLFHPSDLKKPPKPTTNPRKTGSLRRYPTPEERQLTIPRSRSSVEIQKYAEDEDEDPEDFLGKDVMLPHDSDSGSERSTLIMLNSKLASSLMIEDDEDDDPFAQLEEDFDEIDLEMNVQRDRHARLCKFVEDLVGFLKVTNTPDALAEYSEQLMQVLIESPELKGIIVSSHGMLPILEILETCTMPDVVLRLLKIVNMIIYESEELMENLCFIGGVPIITRFADQRASGQIRLEAAAFVRQMCQGSILTLQVFIGCGGLNVLCDFLEEDFGTERDLVLIGVTGIYNCFELQTPKNDFCRILSRNNILYSFSLVLNKVLDERTELNEQIEGRIVHIFHIFSQAENYVKEVIADGPILKRVLKDLRRMSPTHQVTMLKFIKNLSMLDRTHEALEAANAIEILTDLLASSKSKANFMELSNQILNTMYNLCRLSHARQAEAAHSGLIPILQELVWTERPIKEFALPILCDMAHSGKMCRKILWSNKGLQFYVKLLTDRYWQVTALDAIFVWLQEETSKVEQQLLSTDFGEAIVESFTNPDASPDAFENFLDPLQKMLRLSAPIAATLARPEIFSRVAQKLNTKKAVVKLNLLRIIRSICDAKEDHGGATLIRVYGLYDAVQHLSTADQAILVREMASELVKMCDSGSRRSFEGGRFRPGMRRSSSSTSSITGAPMPPSLLSSQSMPVDERSKGTPRRLREARSSYFDRRGLETYGSSKSERDAFGNSASLAIAGSLTPGQFRPTSRDGSSGDRSRDISGLVMANGPPSLVLPTRSAQNMTSTGTAGWGGGSSSSNTPIPPVSLSSSMITTPTSSSFTSSSHAAVPGSSGKSTGGSRLPRTSVAASGVRMTRISLAGARERSKAAAQKTMSGAENSTPTHHHHHHHHRQQHHHSSTPTHASPGGLSAVQERATQGNTTPGSSGSGGSPAPPSSSSNVSLSSASSTRVGSALNPARRRRQTSGDLPVGLGRQASS